MPITVEHVDFLSVPSRDIERARAFYVDTLGLPLERDTPAGIEVTAGQVTLGIWEPEKMGVPFEPAPNHIAPRPITSRCGCPMSGPPATASRPPAWNSMATRSTPASVTWPSSATPTATP